jgi:hypothetical protein
MFNLILRSKKVIDKTELYKLMSKHYTTYKHEEEKDI